MDSFECYALFIALKNHFTQKNYDFFKYHGKTRVNKDSFLSNKDKYKYAKLCRKYTKDNIQDFFIGNFLAGKKWIGEFLDEDSDDIYKQYLKRKQSFTYNFQNEVSKLFIDKGKVFKSIDGQYPDIINKYLQGDISIETITILNEFIDFFDKFDRNIGKDDIVWSKIRLLAEKLKPFLDYDKDKFKEILKQSLAAQAFSFALAKRQQLASKA